MGKQLDHKVVDEMNTRFRMKICEFAVLQADKSPLKGDKLEIVIDHQEVAAKTDIVLQNGASYYVIGFVQGQGYWDMDRITAYQ